MRQQSLAILNSELWTINFFFLEKRISSKYQFRLLYCWGNTFTGRAHHTWANIWPNEEAGEWLVVRTSQPRMGWCMCLNLVLLLFPSNLTPPFLLVLPVKRLLLFYLSFFLFYRICCVFKHSNLVFKHFSYSRIVPYAQRYLYYLFIWSTLFSKYKSLLKFNHHILTPRLGLWVC